MASEVEKPKRKSRPSKWKKRPDAPAVVAPKVKLKPVPLPPCGRCGKPAPYRLGYPGLDRPAHRDKAAYACTEHKDVALKAVIGWCREDGNDHWAELLEGLLPQAA